MQRGFTLIEILIAMAIFTLIGLASTGLLTTVIDSNDISEEPVLRHTDAGIPHARIFIEAVRAAGRSAMTGGSAIKFFG